MTFYHYTCDHGHDGLTADPYVRPGATLTKRAVPWTASVAWFTDLEMPLKAALGLTSIITKCDRTEFCYEVTDPSTLVRWPVFARTLPRGYREMIERADGARPAHWWISHEPVPVKERA